MKTLLLLTLFPLFLFAEGVDVPDGDPLANLLALLGTWQALSPLALGSALIVIIVEALKKFVGDFNYKHVLVIILGCVYAVIQMRIQGLPLGSAVIMMLFSSGGAVALYEALSHLWKKA